jgi:3-methyladenine DNA glycosylase AlkD
MKNTINNTSIHQIKTLLQSLASADKEKTAKFFKTGTGGYAEGDEFIGVPVPVLRKIAREFMHVSLSELQELIQSKINEERLLALIILGSRYKKASTAVKEEIYQFYLTHLQHVNNWNLVDSSAHLIMGAHLINEDKGILLRLAQSDTMWERRIAMVATWYFIRQYDLSWTFKIAEILLNDKHDLIHKAVGWMLREAGKRAPNQLILFLDQHTAFMPRTMLRYAIEKLSVEQRQYYLMRK